MKKALVVLVLLTLVCGSAFAESRVVKEFFNLYDPTEGIFVYNQATPDSAVANIYATGDEFACQGYLQKSIQISGVTVGETIEVVTYGRIAGSSDSPTWVALTSNSFGSASADTAKSLLVDLSTYYVDFIKVGIRRIATNGVSRINVKGLFTNYYK